MKKKIFFWLGRQFVELSGEARSGASVEEETQDLLSRFAGELKALDLSLENTLRTRLWARTREGRTLAAAERFKILTASGKAPSSSYVSPYHFDSSANVALDLIAMKPAGAAAERRPVEFEPPRPYLRFLRQDSVVSVSGFTSSVEGLENQVPEILGNIGETLKAAGTGWNKVMRLSMFLHRSQRPEALKAILKKENKLEIPQLEFGFVDGFAGEKSLIEIETTAVTGP